MRAHRMSGCAATPTDSAYAMLARLKIALPLTHAAVMHPNGSTESTVRTLIELTRELTERLADKTIVLLGQVSVDRRERLMRSLAQEMAYLVARAHERREEIDAGLLVDHANCALGSIDSVPGAGARLFFTETLDQKARWQLALTRAASRIAESMAPVPDIAHQYLGEFLSRLLNKVEQVAREIETHNAEEHITVRVSLLTQFSKSYSRLIFHAIVQSERTGERRDDVAVLTAIDTYHQTIEKALHALKPCVTEAEREGSLSAFAPAI